MRFHLLCILFVFISLSNCNKSSTSANETPEIPADFDIDLDNDGNPDYAINYFDVLVNTVGGRAIFAAIEAYGENEILVKQESPKLFLRDTNEIQDAVEEPLLWVNTGWLISLVRIEIDESGNWPTEWQVDSMEEFEFYLLGVKLVQNNENKIGWIKLQIDKNNGEMMVVEFEFF